MSGAGDDRPTEAGFIDRSLRDEFPGLALRYVLVDRGSGRSNRALKQRLRILSDRFAGRQAIALRRRPIPGAYRVFFRHIGLDPDEQPTPVEEIALERMKRGGFVSRNLLDDALTVAIMESGVAIRAFDADRVIAPLGLRLSRSGEVLAGRPGELPPGTIVVSDQRRPIGLLFGAIAAGSGVSPKTRRMLLSSIQVKGVPDIAVEEALWLAVEALETA